MALVYTNSPLHVIPDAADGISVTPTAAAFPAQSSWVEVHASTPADWAIASIAFEPGVVNTYFRILIGIGPMGSETIVYFAPAIVGTSLVGVSDSIPRCIVDFLIPVEIPAGSRLCIAMEKVIASVVPWKFKINYYETPLVGNAPTTDAAMDRFFGSVAGAGTAWVNSAWLEVDASVPAETLLSYLTFLDPTPIINTVYQIDIGIGTPGNEVAICTLKGDMINTTSLAYGGVYQHKIWPLRRVQAGVRLCYRFRKSGTNTSGLFVDFGGYQAAAADFPDLVTDRSQRWLPDAAQPLLLPAPGSSWGDGAWVQFSAAVPNDLTVVAFHPQADIAGTSEFEFDVGKGALGVEQVVTTHRWGGYAWATGGDRHAFIRIAPPNIASGERLVARVRPNQVGLVLYALSLGVIDNPDFEQRGEQQLVYPSEDVPVKTQVGNTTPWDWSAWGEFHSGFPGDVIITGFVFNGLVDLFTDVEFSLGESGAEVSLTTLTFFFGGIGGTRDHPIPGYPLFIPANTQVNFRYRKPDTSTGPSSRISMSVVYIIDPVIDRPTITDPDDVTIPWRSTDRDITLTATVTSVFGIVNEGTVTFTIDGLPGSEVGNVVNGVATVQFTVPGNTPVDTYDIHAEYSGTVNFGPSDGDAVLTVEPIPTVTDPDDHTLPYSDDDRDITITATVTNPDELVFEGDVDFFIDGIVGLETGTVINGVVQVTFTIPGGTPVGVYTIHAEYLGTSIFLESEGESLLTIFDNPVEVPLNVENPRELQIDDVGAVLRVFVSNQSGAAVDLSGITLADCLLLRRPDNTRVARTPAFQTDGTDGVLLYATVAGDLPISGNYRLQYRHIDDPLNIFSSVTSFDVLENITP